MKNSLFNQEALSKIKEHINNEQRFSLTHLIQIVENAPMAVSITDDRGNMLYVNTQFCSVSRYSSTDLIGKNHSIVSYRTTPKNVYAQLWTEITNGRSWHGELVNKRKTGERYLAEVTISPIQIGTEKPTYFVGFHRDISVRHERITELNNQHQLIAAVLNTVPAAVALVNEKQEVVLDNLAYKTLATDFKAEPMSLVTQTLRQQLDLAAHEKINATHFPENSSMAIELKQGNKSRWFSCRFLNLEIHNSHVDDYFNPKAMTYTVLTLTENTREKRQQEKQRLTELQRSTTETEMMHAMQETMHAVLHQLHKPVNVMESAVKLLGDQPENSFALEPLNLALSAGHDALNQLRNALPERPFEARQSVNLNQIIHDVSAMASEKLLQRSIDLRLTLNGTLPTFTAQPSRLRVALKQLLDNAIEAIDFQKSTEREIHISTNNREETFEVIIEDSGPGIAKTDYLKVFEPFYSTKPMATEGSRGIGLSIVQQVINEHRGTISLAPSPLGGCRVCVQLAVR